MFDSIECPIVGTVVLPRFEKAIGVAFGVFFDRVVDLPLPVLTRRNADRVMHHARLFAGDQAFIAIEGVAEDPSHAAILQRNRICSVSSLPLLLKRERGGAIRVRIFGEHDARGKKDKEG